MKKLLFFSIIAAILVIVSCGRNSSEYKALKAQNDSLLNAGAQNQAELDSIVALFNEIEENLASIKEAENYLNVQSNTPGELTPSVKERVRSDMQFVAGILIKNKEKIAELESKLKKSSLKSGQLQKTIESLRTELETKTKNLVALSTELERKDKQIVNLTANVSALAKDVQNLTAKSGEQQQIINAQQQELNTVYYCYGTAKELKEQKILKNGELNSTLNKEYFIKVKNRNELKTIPLQAKKAELMSKHPAGSYELVIDENKKTELHIIDPQNFWSQTKYLVVKVNI
jgi:chromosome segregation ATPase